MLFDLKCVHLSVLVSCIFRKSIYDGCLLNGVSPLCGYGQIGFITAAVVTFPFVENTIQTQNKRYSWVSGSSFLKPLSALSQVSDGRSATSHWSVFLSSSLPLPFVRQPHKYPAWIKFRCMKSKMVQERGNDPMNRDTYEVCSLLSTATH